MSVSAGAGRQRRGECDHVAYFGEGEVEVPLQSASLGGDDLIKDRGQQERQQHSEGQKEEPRQTLPCVVAVMLTFRLRILLPEQQRTLTTRYKSQKTSGCTFKRKKKQKTLILFLIFVNKIRNSGALKPLFKVSEWQERENAFFLLCFYFISNTEPKFLTAILI